jgi:hypothetical protein
MLNASSIGDSHGKPLHIIHQVEDITDRKLKEARVNHLAFHDALMQLPNRTLFKDRPHQLLALSQLYRTLNSSQLRKLKLTNRLFETLRLNNDDAAITSAIVAMSHRLNLKAIAEGVEDVFYMTCAVDAIANC